MARVRIPNQKSSYLELNKRLGKYVALVQSVFDSMSKDASRIALQTDYDNADGKDFSFAHYPTTKAAIKELQQRFVADMSSIIYRGTSEEWKNSNLHSDLLADKVLASYGVRSKDGARYKKYYQTNSDELKAFQQRKISGMNLSKNLWSQAEDMKTEMEYCISSALQKGTSAVTLAKRVSKYLNNFDELKADYKEKFGRATKCIDSEYRSVRLARSEINMAYRTAEQERWRQMDFVVGYEIRLSGMHPMHDVCDALAGKYPKDFKWTGWHPNDMCYCVPILMSEEEFFANDEYEGFNLQKGLHDAEITDDIDDYYLPYAVRERLEEIKEIKTFNQIRSYFSERGIEVTTDNEKLLSRANEYIPRVAEIGQQLATGVETYETLFGKKALRKLKRINLFDKDLDSTAAYHFNMIGENDPLAGTIRIKGSSVRGSDIFHELAHCIQDSMAKKGEDAITFSNRIVRELNLSDSIKAYFGAAKEAESAERFAQCFGYGFTLGGENNLAFIKEFYKYSEHGKKALSKEIVDVPENFKVWCAANKKYIDESKSLPYFVKDNIKYVEDAKNIELPNSVEGGIFDPIKAVYRKLKDYDYEAELLATPLSELQIENIKECANTLNISVGDRMTFAEADNGRANPNHTQFTSGYTMNCTSCVITHEMRMRGLDVEAVPFGIDNPIMVGLKNNNEFGLWLDGELKEVRPKSFQRKMYGDRVDRLDKLTKEIGRYHIRYTSCKSGGGHILCADRMPNGELRVYDPQSNSIFDMKSLVRLTKSNAPIKVLKVDSLLIKTGNIDKVVKPRV